MTEGDDRGTGLLSWAFCHDGTARFCQAGRADALIPGRRGTPAGPIPTRNQAPAASRMA